MTRSFATIFVDWLSWDSKLPNTGIPSDDFRDKLRNTIQASRYPSFAKEGWLRHQEMAPFLSGADGVVVSSHRLSGCLEQPPRPLHKGCFATFS